MERTFVISPIVAVCPLDELLVYPCEEAYGGICESVGQGLRHGGLNGKVSLPCEFASQTTFLFLREYLDETYLRY